MAFSDLVHRVEHDIEGVLVPRDAPSDTREADAVAKAAEGVAISLDPELEPLFQAAGNIGNAIEGALADLGKVIGDVKDVLHRRSQAAVAPAPEAAPAEPVADEPAPTPTEPATPPPAAADASPASSADASTAATPSDPAPDPTSVPATSTPDGGSTAGPLPAPVIEEPPAPTGPPAETTPAPTSEPPAAPTETPLQSAEDAFAALEDGDKVAFDAAEGLESTPPAAPPAAPPA